MATCTLLPGTGKFGRRWWTSPFNTICQRCRPLIFPIGAGGAVELVLGYTVVLEELPNLSNVLFRRPSGPVQRIRTSSAKGG